MPKQQSMSGPVIVRGFVGGTPGNRPSAFSDTEISEREIREGGLNYSWLYDTALEARRNPTRTERKLWGALGELGIATYFRRQRVFGNYYVDLYCPMRETVVEVDGVIGHATPAEQAKDQRRDDYLRSRGLIVIRVTNKEVWADAPSIAKRLATDLRLKHRRAVVDVTDHEATDWLDQHKEELKKPELVLKKPWTRMRGVDVWPVKQKKKKVPPKPTQT